MKSRTSGVGYALTVSLCLSAGPAWTRDDDASLKERVVRTYPAALAALETRFATAFGSVTGSEQHSIGKPRHIRVVGSFSFASRWPQSCQGHPGRDINDDERWKDNRAQRNGLLLQQGDVILVGQGRGPARVYGQIGFQNQGQRLVCQRPDGVLALLLSSRPILAWRPEMRSVIGDGGAAIERVSSVRRDDQTLLKIEFDFKKGETIACGTSQAGCQSRRRKSG